MMQYSIREHIVRVQMIQVSGRLEAASVGSLREAQDKLLLNGENQFVVDLRTLTFMDSAGMAALVSLLKRARQAGGDVVLVKPVDPAAYRILALTRFDQVFVLKDTPEEALSAF